MLQLTQELLFSLDPLATKNQISAKVFCYCPILIREKTAGLFSFQNGELTKNFGGHLVFSNSFLVTS